MAKMLQIRNVPEALHRKLKVRAASLGISLSDYLITELTELAGRPTMDELLERLAARRRIAPGVSPTAIIRAARDRA